MPDAPLDAMPQATPAALRLARVRERIVAACVRAGRDPASVTLVAVSKNHPAEAVRALALAGQRLFGESYVQEALPKVDALADMENPAGMPGASDRPPKGLCWHFIGRLQKNKVKYLDGRFALIHTVDSLDLARMLHKFSVASGRCQDILLQVNLAREAQKSGCAPEDADAVAQGILELPGLCLRGLMLMPPWQEDPEPSRPWFAGLRELRDRLRPSLGLPLPELSMGMSHDLEQAVEEGATLVRVGTDLFGERIAARQGA